MKKIKLKEISLILILVVCFITFGYSQNIDSLDYWLKIKPLINTRQDVEQILSDGKAGINNKHSIFYKTQYGGINVSYSLGDCTNGVVKEWNVPEWTVTRVFYNTEDDPPKLKSLLKDLGDYKTRIAGDVLSQIEYYNEEKGIYINYSKNTHRVIEIVVEPTLEQEKNCSCDLLNPK